MRRLHTQLATRLRGIERALRVRPVPSADQVHLARQHVKQARAILRLLRRALSRTEFHRVDRELRTVGLCLRRARERAVLRETLALLASERAYMRPAVESIQRHWRSHFRGLRPPQPQRADLTGALHHLQGAVRRVQGWQLPADNEAAVHRALVRSYRKGRRACERARRSGTSEDWHACRRQAKYLDYQLGCASSLSAPLQEVRKQAHRLGSLLGKAHDLADLRSALRRTRLEASPSGAAVLLRLEERERYLVRHAERAARKVYRRKAADFAASLRERPVRFTARAAGSPVPAVPRGRRRDARAGRGPPAR